MHHRFITIVYFLALFDPNIVTAEEPPDPHETACRNLCSRLFPELVVSAQLTRPTRQFSICTCSGADDERLARYSIGRKTNHIRHLSKSEPEVPPPTKPTSSEKNPERAETATAAPPTEKPPSRDASSNYHLKYMLNAIDHQAKQNGAGMFKLQSDLETTKTMVGIMLGIMITGIVVGAGTGIYFGTQ